MGRILKIIYSIGNAHDLIYKFLLFLVFTVALVYILPREGKFKYEIRLGKRWMEKDLYAPFDFGIYKSADEIDKEVKEISAGAKPYLKLDTIITEQKINRFNENLDHEWIKRNNLTTKKKIKNEKSAEQEQKKDDSLKNCYSIAGTLILRNIYEKGILNPDLGLDKKYEDVIILRNNIAREEGLDDLFTMKSASEFCKSSFHKFKDRITKIGKLDTVFLCSLMQKSIDANVFYDEETTKKIHKSLVDNIAPTRGKIKKGELIISDGSMINKDKFLILESLRKEYELQAGFTFNFYYMLLGQILFALILVIALLAFLFSFRKDVLADNNKIVFLLLLVYIIVASAKVVIKVNVINLYILPFCILPIILRIFYDTRLSLFVHLLTILFIAYMAPNSYEFAFLQIIAGFIAIVSVINMRNRSQLFISAVIIFVTYCAAYTAIAIIQEGNFDNIKLMNYVWFASSSALSLFAYPLMYIFEKLFGFVSDVTLLELSDTNSPLLRQLSERAPGTFNHSIQVANLAEEAIFQIGGNPLLARTGALYHDIGKMDLPIYYIENQPEGMNPHEELSNEDSSKIIISHINRGIRHAKEHKLPEPLIDFIRSHHGTNVVMFFYRSFLREHPDEPIDRTQFAYPGPLPFSKETAVLMMADCVEAASRALKVSDPEHVDKMVEEVINYQIENGQFVNADITFKDITTIKKIFKKKLINIHHLRIEYPH